METALTRTQCHVSKLIGRAMKLTGISSYGCFLSRNKTLIQDYLYLTSSNKVLEMIQGGSAAEGTYTLASDVDRMIIIPDITVHTKNKKPKFTKGHWFSLDEVGSSPGYGRLRLLKLEDTEYQIFDGYNANIRDLFQETPDGTFLSSEKFVNFFVSITKSMEMSGYYRHGPCASTEHQDVHGYLTGKPGIKMEEDIAHALVCDDWPSDAQKWITRKRNHDWPPKNIIEKISKMKCHAVPVGNKGSNNFSLEWRTSFLLGERELIWSFNDTQVQCYVLLKQLFKKHISAIAPDQLSSYHIKTVMFWMSEERGTSMWYDENLLGCVTECLNMLSHCVKEHKLQHYFDKERNLLDNKLDNESDKDHVLQKIDEILADVEQYVTDCLEGWDIISEMCSSCLNSHKNFKLFSKKISFLQDEYEQDEKANIVLQLYKTMFNIYINITSGYNIPSVVFRQLIYLERNPPEDVEFQILESTKVFIDVRLGMTYFGHISAPKDELFQQWLDNTGMPMEKAHTMLGHGRLLDSLSGTLYLASIYLCQGKFSISNDLVLSVLRQDKNLVYPGWCSAKRTIHLTKEGHSKLESTIHLIGTEGRTFPAFDVIFSSDDANCVPYPIKFECILAQNDSDDFIVIHPCVYAYFLLCLGQFCERRYELFANTLEQLEQLVCQLGEGFHTYRALNLLGYCYSLRGNVNAALSCYSVSLKRTQSSPGVKNAAVYFICIILVKCLEVPRGPEVLYERQKQFS